MNILVDFVGHADLYYSMHALFEKRLGWNLFRPFPSIEWNNVGVQTVPQMPSYCGDPIEVNGFTTIPTNVYNYSHKLITWTQFLQTDFDYILITGHENESPFAQLVRQYKPNATLVRQIANVHELPNICKNVLRSVITPMPAGVRWTKYVPEHYLDAYWPEPPQNVVRKQIKSHFNYMYSLPDALDRWERMKSLLPDFEWYIHGGESKLGWFLPSDFPNALRDSMFVWHAKPMGCCGYVARQALTCGKPLIVDKRYSKVHMTLANDYLVDGANCIDIGCRSFEEAAKIIREWSNPDIYQEKSTIAANTFTDTYFANEAAVIRNWLLQLPKGI